MINALCTDPYAEIDLSLLISKNLVRCHDAKWKKRNSQREKYSKIPFLDNAVVTIVSGPYMNGSDTNTTSSTVSK